MGSKLFLFGGRQGNKVYGDLHVLDLCSLQWSEVRAEGKPPSPRFSHTMTLLGSQILAVNGGCPITRDKALVLLNTSSMIWVRLELDWPREFLLVRHTTTLVGDYLLTVGGGAACFAFGTYFSPPLKLKLADSRQYKTLAESSSLVQAVISQPKEYKSPENTLCWVFKVDARVAKRAKDVLKDLGWLETTSRSRVLGERECVAFPIVELAASVFLDSSSFPSEGRNAVSNDLALQILRSCKGEVLRMDMPKANRECKSPMSRMEAAVNEMLLRHGLPSSLLRELPRKWEQLGDLVVIPAGSLTSNVWSSLGDDLWKTVASSLNAKRLARQAPIAARETRDSQLQLLYGEDGWVEHHENGITYCFDATKCMFSSGNVSEKHRVGSMKCRDATVVDLFAGIGYYVLPFLIKAGARHVYACEWNPHAIKALRHNLRVNGVEGRCTVLEGNNRGTAPAGVADVVSLGLLPSSEGSWLTAVSALRAQGGLLLVHANVKDTEEQEWVTQHLLKSLQGLATSIGRTWSLSVAHLERVKWYAPHIRHIVVDVLCAEVR